MRLDDALIKNVQLLKSIDTFVVCSYVADQNSESADQKFDENNAVAMQLGGRTALHDIQFDAHRSIDVRTNLSEGTAKVIPSPKSLRMSSCVDDPRLNSPNNKHHRPQIPR